MPPKTPTSSKHKKSTKSPSPSPRTPSSSCSNGSSGKKSISSSTGSLSSSRKKSISPGVKSASILSFFQPPSSSRGNNNSSSTPKKRSISEMDDSQGGSAEDAFIILDDDDDMVGMVSASSDGSKLFSSAIIDIDGGNDEQVTIVDNSPVEMQGKHVQQFSDSQLTIGSADSQGLNEEDSFDGVRSYYLFHFLEILDTVIQRDGHLFIEEEKEYINNFNSLCTASQRLYIRMYNRKQKYFTKTELDKYKKEMEKVMENEELGEDRKKNNLICCRSVKEALSHLGSVKLIDSLSIVDKDKSSTEWNIDDLKNLLSEFTNKQLKSIIDKKNLSNIVKKEKPKKTTDSPKQDLIKTIITKPEALNSVGSDGKQQKKLTFLKKKEPEQPTVKDENSKESNPTTMKPSDILKLIAKGATANKEIETMYYRLDLLGQAIFKRIHHLYFLSQSADNATVMILEQKKIMTFPKYEIQEQKSLFSSRDDFMKYEEAFDIANTWMDSIDVPDTTTSSKQNGHDSQNSQDTLLSNIEIRLDMIQKIGVEGIIEKFNNFSKDISSKLEQDTLIIKKMYEESNTDFTMDYYLLRFRCGYIYGRILWFCVKVLERNKNYELAITYIKQIIESPFMIGKRGEFYNRLALDYEHLKTEESYKNALNSCKSGILNDSNSVFSRSISLPPNKLYALEKRYFRICKKLEKINAKKYSLLSKDCSITDKFISTNVKPPKLVYIQGKTKKLQNRKYREKKHHFISHKDNETVVNVEEFALEHYEMKNCMQGSHSEGSLWAMMFMLVMWNVVFDSSIPYVFQNKYQSFPLDFMTDAFYIRRREKFKKRLEEIEEKGSQYLKDQIKTCWNENYGVNAVCCNWRSFSEPKEEDEEGTEMTIEILNEDEEIKDSQTETKENEKLQALLSIAECFPIKVISTILQTLAEDIKENRSGMPDLILWKIQENGKHEHLLSEIKGPGDKLSEKQIIWIDLLTKAGCSIEVCHVKVKEDGSNSSTPEQPSKKRKYSSDSQIEFLDDDLWNNIDDDQQDNEDGNNDNEDEIDLLKP